jgi:hypothetical protein
MVVRDIIPGEVKKSVYSNYLNYRYLLISGDRATTQEKTDSFDLNHLYAVSNRNHLEGLSHQTEFCQKWNGLRMRILGEGHLTGF